jgi:hypothetical protein
MLLAGEREGAGGGEHGQGGGEHTPRSAVARRGLGRLHEPETKRA